MSEYVVRRIYVVLTALAFCFFLVRLGNGGIPEESLEELAKVQPLIEIILMFGFLVGIVPLWVDKMKSTPLKNTVQYGAIVLGLALIILVFPEFTEVSYGEQRFVVFFVTIAVLAVFFVISYLWGKRHGKDDESKEVEE